MSKPFGRPSRVETGSINSLFLVGNPGLKPEVARTTELVWLHAIDNAPTEPSRSDRIELHVM